MGIQRFGIRSYAGGRVRHAAVVRAGKWVFGTGLRASDESGLIDAGVRRDGHPLSVPPRAQREAEFIFDRLRYDLAQADSSLGHVVRVDQYYPHWSAVDPYHVARKNALGKVVAPSTSILVERLLNLDAQMDLQVLAVTKDSGLTPEPINVARVGAPKESGYSASLRVGDLVFVAGQLARDESGGLAPEAQVPAGQLWKGTRIKLETGYLVRQRLQPALQASGSGLDLVLKAQVYLSCVDDLPAFWQAWSEAFDGNVPPTTIVPVKHPGFGTQDATIEVNVIAANESARDRIKQIDCDVELVCPGMAPARAFDGLLFVSGLMAIDSAGVVDAARSDASMPFYQSNAAAEMADILGKAKTIFEAAGSDLSQVVRALHFHTDLADFYDTYREWEKQIGDIGLPFSAIQVNERLFVPGTTLILDLWGFIPES